MAMERGELARPRRLEPGAAIGVCAPAGPVIGEGLECGLDWLRSEGYTVRCGKTLRLRSGYLAGSDAERRDDLVALVRDPQVGAIILARGGYGVGRILPDLDAVEFRTARKPIVGYSDATLLFQFLRDHAGLAAVHGPMLERTDTTPQARARLLALLRGDAQGRAPLPGRALRSGLVTAPLVGGNLKVIAASLGTPWEIDTRGAILFFEDLNEQPYAIDRVLVQLREAGKLRGAVGCAVGALVGCASERYPETSACDVVREILVPEISGPVVAELPFGHVADNRALGHGVRAELDGDRATLTLVDPVVENGE